MARKQKLIRVYEDTIPLLERATRIAAFREDKSMKTPDLIHSLAEGFIEKATETEKKTLEQVA